MVGVEVRGRWRGLGCGVRCCGAAQAERVLGRDATSAPRFSAPQPLSVHASEAHGREDGFLAGSLGQGGRWRAGVALTTPDLRSSSSLARLASLPPALACLIVHLTMYGPRTPSHRPTTQIGKNLGDLQAALPLRAVCREWAETVTLGAEAAELDLAPDSPSSSATEEFDPSSSPAAATASLSADDADRRSRFYRRCPFVRQLTYHVSPGVTLAKVRLAVSCVCIELAACALGA